MTGPHGDTNLIEHLLRRARERQAAEAEAGRA